MITPFSLLSCYLIIGVALGYLFVEIDGVERLSEKHPDINPRLLLCIILVYCLFAWPIIAFAMLIIAAFGMGEE